MDPLLLLSGLVRTGHYASVLLLFGSLVFARTVARPAVAAAARATAEGGRLRGFLAHVVAAALGATVLTALLWLWLLAASMSGRPLGAALEPRILALVLSATKFGHVWLMRMALAACLVPTVTILWRRGGMLEASSPATLALALAALLLAATGWAGHAGDESGADGDIHLGADMLHLLAAGAWIGALPGLVFLLTRASDEAARGWFRIA